MAYTFSSSTSPSRDYRKEGETAKDDLLALFNNHTDWTLESRRPEQNYELYSTTSFVKTRMKVFKLQAVLDYPAKTVWEVTTTGVENSSWNKTVKDVKVIQHVDEKTAVLRQTTPEAAMGIVKARDFINIQYRDQIDNMFISAIVCTEHPDWPEQQGFIRGENGPGGLIFKPLEGDPGKCTMYWYLASDLKGSLPSIAIDFGLPKVTQDFLKCLREHLKKVNK